MNYSPNDPTPQTTNPEDQQVLGFDFDARPPVECRAQFSDSCPIVCTLPDGHSGFHVTRTKSDSIASISWQKAVAK